MSDTSQHNPVADNAEAEVQPITDKPSQAEGEDPDTEAAEDGSGASEEA